MKTCTNPKCNTTNIPDDATFCPVCGEALVEVTNPWKEKYDVLLTARKELLVKKKQLSLFEAARQKMYSTLKQDGNYDAVMQENREIIKAKRETKGKTPTLVKVAAPLLVIGFIMAIAGGTIDNKHVMAIGLILFGIGLFLIIGFAIASPERSIVGNKYITNFLEPFIKGHSTDYNDIDISVFYLHVLESEIFEPEMISEKVSRKIEEITEQIESIDHQMQLIQKME